MIRKFFTTRVSNSTANQISLDVVGFHWHMEWDISALVGFGTHALTIENLGLVESILPGKLSLLIVFCLLNLQNSSVSVWS